MKIILIFLFIAFSLSNNSLIYDIPINTEYEIDLSLFPEYEIPNDKTNIFRLAVENNDKLEIQFKTFHGMTKFKVDVCLFSNRPTDDEILANQNNCEDNIKLIGISQYEFYDIYKYHIETKEKTNYISIQAKNMFVLDYLSIYVYSYSNKPKYTLYDIPYMKEYELNSTSLKEHEGIYLFRLENNNGKIDKIKLKINNKISSKISIKVAGFRDKPNTTDDFENYIKLNEPQLKSLTNDEEYSVYEYPYEKIDGSGYICVFLQTIEKLDYLSIYMGL